MQIFELHFNPKLREDLFFDSFIYEPFHIYEKKLGSLYAVGELRNALPNNSKLLDNLTKTIKEKYYNFSHKTPEKAISESLKKANEFLQEEVKKENVSWLGNLNFSVISIKDFNLTFTKTGEIKILFLREGEITDIGKNLDLEEIDPYPLKIFFNIVSGKLMPDDIILVFTKEIYDFFLQQNLSEKISQLGTLNEKNLKGILPQSLFSKKEGAEVSGICFLAVLNKETMAEGKPKEILFQKERKFSFSEIFAPLQKPFQSLKSLKNRFKAIKIKKPSKILKKLPKPKKISPPQKLSKKRKKKTLAFPSLKELIKISFPRKKIILILVLSFLLLLGYLVF